MTVSIFILYYDKTETYDRHSAELDGIVGLLASRKKMNYSEYVESRLKLVPEILNELQRLQSGPEDAPPMIKGSLKNALKATDDIEAEQNNLVA